VVLSTYQPTKFTSYDSTAGAVRAGSLGQLFIDELDALLEQEGGDHNDPAIRRKAAVELLAQWKDRPASASAPDAPSLADQLGSADFERAITGFARNVQRYAEAALPPIDVAGATGGLEARFRAQVEQVMAQHGWAAENVQLRRQAAREVLTAWGREPRSANYGDAENLAAQLPTDVYERVVYGGVTNAGPPPWDQKSRGIMQAMENGVVTMTEPRGFAQCTVAAKHYENVPSYGTSAIRLYNEAALLSEMDRGATDGPPQYGSKGIAQPEATARERAFTENCNARLRTMDIMDKDRVGNAYRAEAALCPQLTPDYGWSTRASRRRG